MLQSGHCSRDRRTDGQTDGQTDGVKPIYPPTTSLFGGCSEGIIRIVRISTTTFELNPLESTNFPDLIKNKIGENYIWSYAGALQTWSIASAISDQHIATKLCIPIEQISQRISVINSMDDIEKQRSPSSVTTLSFVYHFRAISELKLELQSENA